MSHDRHRVQEDLRGVVAGEVLCSEVIADLYARDAGPFWIRPLGVVRPRNTQDVVEVVRYAAEHQIPVHARGAGTSSAAQSLGPGIVLDFSRFMRRVLREDGSDVTVEPGLTIGQLNGRLAKEGRCVPFAPWSDSVSTIAGGIARDSHGRYTDGFGRAGDHLTACEVVLADGSVVELGTHRLEPDLRGSTPPRIQQLVRRLAAALTNYTGHANRTGTAPEGIRPAHLPDRHLGGDSIALCRFLADSQGTIGLMTWVKIRTAPLPRFAGILPLFFDRVERAAEAALLVRSYRPGACDLLDRRHLTIVREIDPRYEMAIPPEAEAMLIVELCGDDDAIAAQLQSLAGMIGQDFSAATAGDVAADPADVAFYRYLAEAAPRLVHRIGGTRRPVSLAEELVVPPDRLPGLIAAAQSLLQRSGITASFYAHAASGCLQLRPFLDLASDADRQQVAPFCEALSELVWEFDGVLGANAACAIVCGSRYPRTDSSLLDLQREVKRAFDAEGLLNPGKIAPTTPFHLGVFLPPLPAVLPEPPADSPDVSEASADPPGEAEFSDNGDGASLPILTTEFGWTVAELRAAAAKCSGCGVCRVEHDRRMCPINHIAPREEASPRAKANLVRSIVSAPANGAETEESEVKAIADLCVHCHMCRVECPAEVDIPRLMAEAKAQHVRTNGLRFSDWMMVHVDSVAGFSRRVRHLANWALGNPAARWVLEKGTGIARTRRLPKLEQRSFLHEAKRRRLTVPAAAPEKVAFFVDTYVNHFDVELGLALAAVFEHNGVMVWVPPGQKQAGMTMISRGVLDPARDIARHNAGVLAEAVRQGYTIVATEPSAVLALTREYRHLLPDDTDAESVAQHTVEACQYLWQLHQNQRLRLDFKRLDATLGYHAPCHLLALGIGTPAENLMRLVPGLHVQRLEHGCSGMAGTYGLQHRNYRNSLRAGLELLTALRKTPLTAGATECSTCRIQMQHGTDRPTVHPIKVLALAYGLMPELKRHLFSGGRALTLQ